jgi:hypothetical protein
MALKTGLRTLLLAQSSITTLCPAQTLQGISYPAICVEALPQGMKPPYIVISSTGHDPMKALDGTTGMASTEIDIECVEYTDDQAEALAKAVSDYLKDYTGAAGSSDTIDAVLWDSKTTFVGQEQDGKNLWRFNVQLSFTIQHH